MMNCQEARGLFSRRVDNELDEGLQNDLEEHLLECTACLRQFDELRHATSRVRAHLSEFRLTAAEKQQIRETVMHKISRESV